MQWWSESIVTRVDDLFDRFPEHLSVDELAQVLGVTRNTAYKWLQQGDVPAYQLGGTEGGRAVWVILRDEVKDWFVQHHNQDQDTQADTSEQ